ncbi:MAG: cytochrome c4, partial [Candidatus Thiodiazotropha taylori]|nr:cytochrome c4 [Candidatus Thiodiazotropha taylori]MCW4251266.1 cytochrome c4 [Candidatus Thiodiazotropha taylori]
MAYKNLKRALIGALALSASSVAFAADKPLLSGASASMLANTCAGCHGTNGASIGPASPSIGGISAV